MQFTLIVRAAECADSIEKIHITAPTSLANQVYYITKDTGYITVQDFTEDSKYCTS